MKNEPTDEQKLILKNNKKNMIISASAGSGKTFVVIEYLINLICKKNIPLSRLLVLTFTKAAANEMKTRLYKAILEEKPSEFLLNQLDELQISDISTIDAFCEKMIKRNINKINLDDNFTILDEKASKNLKLMAFNRVFDSFSVNNTKEFDEIYFAFKKNKEQIFGAMLDFASFFDSSFDGEKLAQEFIDDTLLLEERAEDYIKNYIKEIFNKVKNEISFVCDLPKPYQELKDSLNEFTNIELDQNLIDVIDKINDFKILNTPRNKIENLEDKKVLVEAKEKLKEVQKLLEPYKDLSIIIKNKFKDNSLIKALLNFYKEQQKEYKILKENRWALDFADLEIYAKKLLEDEDVAKDLQDKYDYIFIDEYQDTNTLQEAIIKPIAKKGFFVAVGDPKQGIYGFRNASMEIMKKDIEDFSKDENSDALFLTGNFRSDERLLSFINEIFIKVMTEESVGIDYEKTSKLKGLQPFEKGRMPSVCLDLILNEKEEKEAPKGVYSVKEDKITLSEENLKEVKVIALRIEEALESQIYDAKRGCFRKVSEGDIALLFRGRSALMQDCVRFLQDKGFNIVADIKQDLLEDSQIRVLLALFKLAINFKDDISLVSVMNSWIGDFSLDEICEIRFKDREKRFYQLVEESEEGKIIEFKKKIEEFYFESQLLGVSKALYNLFNRNDFQLFINSLPSKNIKKSHINQLFKIIKSGDFENNLAGLVNYLENIKSDGEMSEQSSNAITITTIHATKGLEYPIVILCGCGEKLSKVYNKPYLLSRDFGLGTYLYDYDENIRVLSLTFLAGKLSKKRKEFIDELMIFYVALTRAQNHLFLIGSVDDINFSQDIFDYKNYLEIILNSFGENFTQNLFSQEYVKKGDWEFRVISDVVDKSRTERVKEKLNFKIDNICEYIDYQYKNKDKCFLPYKNSVSSLLKLDEEDILEESRLEFSNEDKISRERAILRGNAYHEALKIIDFDLVNSKEDLIGQELENKMMNGYFEFIDFDLLYKNIKIIKSTIGGGKTIKERQFIMQTSLKEVGISDGDDNVIVQGIVDLFVLGEKNILIDYKFTSIRDENRLKEKYHKQIELYSLAIEKAFGVKVDEKYLLSLKDALLIKVN